MTVPCVPAPPSCWTWLFFRDSSQNGKKKAEPSTSTGSYTTAENRVKNSGTYGLNFPQLTQECNKSGPWRKAATRPQRSEHLKESSPPQSPRDFLPYSSPWSLSSSKGSHPPQGAGTRGSVPSRPGWWGWWHPRQLPPPPSCRGTLCLQPHILGRMSAHYFIHSSTHSTRVY